MGTRGERFPSEFIKADPDLWDKANKRYREVTVTINGVGERKMRGKDGADEIKSVLWIKGTTKGLILNATNWDTIAEGLGLNDDADWKGHKVTLFVVENFTTPFGTSDVIRVKMPSGAASNGASATPVPVVVSAPMEEAAVAIFGGEDEGGSFDPDEIPF